MDEPTLELIDRLTAARSGRWLRVIADARLDDPVEPEPAPAAVVTPYRWLIEAVGDGVKLSQSGYLPPGFVERAMGELGWSEGWPGKHNREDHTIPVRDLRESAQRLGLLRKQKGHLLVTTLGRKLAHDPEALWWHVAERLPDARSELERHAGLAYLLLVAAGRPRDDHMLAEALTALGWVDRTTRAPISDHDAFFAARDTWDMFRRLGVLPERRRWDEPERAPTEAAIRLARAALIGRDSPARSPRSRPRLRVVGEDTGQVVQLTVTLRDVTPPVWRRLAVPASLTLRELHEVIQAAMGWQGYHLHLFEVDGVLYGDVEDFPGRLGDEDKTTVGRVAAAVRGFRYEYDFGDSWEHDITVEGVSADEGSDRPRVVGGARACPPEDCGGSPGYAQLLEVIADPSHDEYAQALDWVGGSFDAEAFDPATADGVLSALWTART